MIAAELLAAAEAIDCHAPLAPAPATAAAHAAVRALVPRLDGDRPPAPLLERLAEPAALAQIVAAANAALQSGLQ